MLEREPDKAAANRAARNAKIGIGIAYGVGGIGFGMFGVAGGLALRNANRLKANCLDQQCPSTEAATLDELGPLATVSTVGLIVGGLGVAAGTTIVILTRPGENKRPTAPGVNLEVGLGGFAIDGQF